MWGLATKLRAVVATNSRAAFSTARTPEEMAVLHHGVRPRHRATPKFQSPRKRATKLLHELQTENIESNKIAKPAVWDTQFRVGDAIELVVGREQKNAEETTTTENKNKNNNMEKIRGVVLGISRKGLDHSVLLRDVVFGQPVERRMLLHSPLVQSVQRLEENFVYKGKRKVKRAKLYFLRDRNPECKSYIDCCSFCIVVVYVIKVGAHSHTHSYYSLFSDSRDEMVIDSSRVKQIVIIIIE